MFQLFFFFFFLQICKNTFIHLVQLERLKFEIYFEFLDQNHFSTRIMNIFFATQKRNGTGQIDGQTYKFDRSFTNNEVIFYRKIFLDTLNRVDLLSF